MPHVVTNQPPPLVDYDAFEQDLALVAAVERESADWGIARLHEIGQQAGSAEWQQRGTEANAHAPVLRTHDRYGNRIDEVEFHPAWHAVLDKAIGWGMHGGPWREPRPGAQVARAAGFYLWSQVEAGHACPVSMTFAAVPVLRRETRLAAIWEPRLTAETYDPGMRPIAEKRGALCGMAMTEKQGGSDLRANSTRAEPDGDGAFRLTGHKWFCSAPMSDAFLVLAQSQTGLSCFLVPRVLPDGCLNGLRLVRLKDKLGNRSNASAEIELDHAWAAAVGDPGQGVQTIAEMVNSTRLDCVLGTAALMRQAVAQATHHAGYRSAFGRLLVDQPLMTNVLADLAVESEAATLLAMRLAGAADRSATNPREAQYRRIGTAIAKYWVCKRGPAVVSEALECLGGNGYVEDSGMPRLYREAPLNSIWEGSGNVNALDVLRILARTPEALDAFFEELGQARGADRRLDAALQALKDELMDWDDLELRARRIVERMALVLQGSLLVRFSPAGVADAFCASRLAGDRGAAFGTLPRGCEVRGIVARATPQAAARGR